MINDMRSSFEKAGMKAGGDAMQKKCRQCGKNLKPDSKFDTCFECGSKGRTGASVPSDLPKEYLELLARGYHDAKGNVWEELITTMASQVAQVVGADKKLTNGQLRRFYQHAKAAENRLNMTGDWPAVNIDVKKLGPFAAEAKAKGKIPNAFFVFLDRNVSMIKSQKDFDAFLQHFQAVVAFFTYHYPRV